MDSVIKEIAILEEQQKQTMAIAEGYAQKIKRIRTYIRQASEMTMRDDAYTYKAIEEKIMELNVLEHSKALGDSLQNLHSEFHEIGYPKRLFEMVNVRIIRGKLLMHSLKEHFGIEQSDSELHNK